MNKVNFNAFKNIHASEEQIAKALAIPDSVKNAPVAVPWYRRSRMIGAAASVVLVMVVGITAYFLFGNKTPPVKPADPTYTASQPAMSSPSDVPDPTKAATLPSEKPATEPTVRRKPTQAHANATEVVRPDVAQGGVPIIYVIEPGDDPTQADQPQTENISEPKIVHDPTLPAQRPTELPSAVTPTKSPIISQTELPASPTAEPIIPQTDPIEPIEVEPTTGRPRSDLASVGLMIPIGSYSGSDEIFCRLSDSSGREIGSKDLFDESHRVYFTTGSGYLLLSYPLSVVDEPLPPGNYTMIFYDADGNDFYISTVYLSKGSR